MSVNSFNASNPPLTTKGDLYGFSTVPARVPVGTNGQVLTADSTATNGVAWATAAGGSDNYTLINTGGTALTGASTITVSGISNKNSLIIVVKQASSVSTSSNLEMRFNSDSTLKYDYTSVKNQTGGLVSEEGFASNNSIDIAGYVSGAANTLSMFGKVDGAGSTGLKFFQFTSFSSNPGSAKAANYTYSGTSTISSVSFISSSGNFDAGTVYVYGA